MENINNGHLHEAIDRLHVIQCNIETHLQNHSVFDKKLNPEWSKELNKVQDILGNLYQNISSKL